MAIQEAVAMSEFPSELHAPEHTCRRYQASVAERAEQCGAGCVCVDRLPFILQYIDAECVQAHQVLMMGDPIHIAVCHIGPIFLRQHKSIVAFEWRCEISC